MLILPSRRIESESHRRRRTASGLELADVGDVVHLRDANARAMQVTALGSATMQVSAVGVASVAAAWTPDQQSGLVYWDKYPITGLNNNDPVSSWLDSSGNGNTPTQSGAARPTYLTSQTPAGGAAVHGNGSSQYLNKTGVSFSTLGGSDWTIFFLTKAGSLSTRILFIIIGGGGRIYCYQNISGKQRVNQKDDLNNDLFPNGAFDVTQPAGWYYCVIRFIGLTATVRMNGANSGSIGATAHDATTASNLTLLSNNGGSEFNDGYLAEIGIYNSGLTGTALTNLETYLASR